MYKTGSGIYCDARGAPPKILPRAPNWLGPGLLTRIGSEQHTVPNEKNADLHARFTHEYDHY